uniref:dolichyl-phosphate-mannose--protein mannosyltransferase n=1 Tax=Schistocephalus solidus TaxID=70667 RepID=A0A183T8W6_SCHSO
LEYAMRIFTHGSFAYLFLVLLSSLIYLNALFCEFVFDDSSAIVDNRDLRPKTPVDELFKNDFWGTRMDKESSHKSYRPLTVLTFRWNYALGRLDPFGYHAVNVALHCCVTILFYRYEPYLFADTDFLFISSKNVAPSLQLYYLRSIPFTLKRYVTSVVGRAELLSAAFFLIVLNLYLRLLNRKYSFYSTALTLLIIDVLIFAGTLCKEQCITVVAVAFAYDFLNTFKFPAKVLKLFFLRASCKDHSPFRQFIFRTFFLAGGAIAFLLFRLRIMKSELPHFTPFDNPAAHAGPLSRRLTHLYLIFFNLKLLFFPSSLCADWTMGSIPLVASWIDSRNLQTFSAFVLLFVVGVRSIHPRTPRKQALSLMMGLSLMVFPFIPASNLFFYVGFVVAERVLYIPSLGFCLLIGLGFQNICRALSAPGTSSSSARRTSIFCFLLEAVEKAARQSSCCSSWLYLLAKPFGETTTGRFAFRDRLLFSSLHLPSQIPLFPLLAARADEYSLFTSAVRVNQHNAKLWNNVGHALEARNNYSEALHFFQKAVEYVFAPSKANKSMFRPAGYLAQPNDMGAHINVGRTFVNLGLYKEAEAAYTRALDYFPKPRKGRLAGFPTRLLFPLCIFR